MTTDEDRIFPPLEGYDRRPAPAGAEGGAVPQGDAFAPVDETASVAPAGASLPADEDDEAPLAGAHLRVEPQPTPVAEPEHMAAPDIDAAVAAPLEASAPEGTGDASFREAPFAGSAPADDGATPYEETSRASAQVAQGVSARPDTTAEIDVTAVESRLGDPGSTMSFAPITEERIDTDSTYDAGTTTSLMWGARSDVGCVRTHNEDSYLVQSPLFCVCDGMGGHAAGEVASSIAVETVARMAPKAANPSQLAAAIEAANAAIIEAAENGLGKPGMGCTATAAYIEGNTIALAHVGDSRAYLVHEGTLIRVTRDHSYVEELVDAGEITADEARVHPNRSVITRALGSDPAMYADHFQLNIEEGDRLILCSDGLSSMIPDGEIEEIANQSATAQICVDNLVDAALAAGGSDNVTVVVVDVVDDGRMREIMRRRRRNVIIALVAFVATFAIAGIVLAVSITNSLFLGVKDDHVAIYNGIPETFLGIDLYWLNDETAIELENLPEDTQNRLRDGIPQSSMDDARDTLSRYRKQIDEALTRQANIAEAVGNVSPDAAAGAYDEGSSGEGPESADASGDETTQEGGAAQ